tara:strand:- start:21 stop:1061 length:1041 start_codon:yes stop_codon:yes gene_type:complete
MQQRSSQFLTVGSTRIHAVCEGEGPLVILVHGFPESWYSWRHQLSALAEAGYRAVAIDLRGYGRSSKFLDSEYYLIKSVVEDIVGVVRALGASSAVVVGHDWGAMIAWTAAWLHPEIFRGVVGLAIPFSGRGLIALPGSPFGERSPEDIHKELAGPDQQFYQDYFGSLAPAIREFEEDSGGWMRDVLWAFSGESMKGAGLSGLLDLPQVDIIRASALSIPFGARMRDKMHAPADLPVWLGTDDLDFYTQEFERSGMIGPFSYYRGIQKSWEQLESHDGTQLLPPAMFIGGECDVTTGWGLEAIDRVGEFVPNYVGSHILSGCGHWIQQERPEEVNELVLGFMRELV